MANEIFFNLASNRVSMCFLPPCPDHFMHYQISIVLFCIACHRHQGQIFFSIQFQTMPASCSEPTRKVWLMRDKPAPYQKTSQASKTLKDALQMSALPPKPKGNSNLTLSDWLMVFAHIDTHPDESQHNIVAHFANQPEGALVFNQGTLSQKLKTWAELELHADSNPTALSSKWPWVVTRPDVEEALVKWVHLMEGKNKQVSGAMLQAKRGQFEDLFEVPEEERLTGPGWIGSFCRTYGIKEHRKHGESAFVDLEAIANEHVQMQSILSCYSRKDTFNFDETSFYSFVPPNRGLCTKAMAGRKEENFRIMVGLACNADGSEKWPLIFIGFLRKPCCFKSHTAASMGIYYRNNKTAWMTRLLFEEWIKGMDLEMHQQNRNVCLTMDNFSTHKIAYQPMNIKIIFFEPNLTPFLQLLDAGIIHCFKAHYQRSFCE